MQWYQSCYLFFSLSHTHIQTFKHTNSAFSSSILFFYCLSLLSGFSSQLNPHSENPFLILRNTGPIIDSIKGLLLLWRAHHSNYPHTHTHIIGKFRSCSKSCLLWVRLPKTGWGKREKWVGAPFILYLKMCNLFDILYRIEY